MLKKFQNLYIYFLFMLKKFQNFYSSAAYSLQLRSCAEINLKREKKKKKEEEFTQV
jgi:hypothetical protein